jgi:glycosyltransferase involved in cell wall biosynthesis
VYSVVILTLNEERNLPKCLDSLHRCDDVVVLDSGSTDATCEIARRAGVRVVQNPFENFSQQRNFAHQQIEFRAPWVLHLDADEVMTESLHLACANFQNDGQFDGCWIAPKMMWFGRWIPRCTDFPAWQARFVHAKRFRFIQVGHGQREHAEMRMTKLSGNYLHDLSNDGIDGWLEKHRRYAKAEAAAQYLATPLRWPDMLSGDRLMRRRALKQLSYMIPFRSFARFVYQYILRGGIMEGHAGWTYCRLLARYEGFAQHELKMLRKKRGATFAQSG